jgi:5-formyltetrahydrofolate cyclo-ligase
MTKLEWRKKIAALLPLAGDKRLEKSARLCAAIVDSEFWSAARTVVFYAAQMREPSLHPLWAAIGGRTIAFPLVEGEDLGLYRVESEAELRAGRWGLREPEPCEEKRIAAESVDLVLVPGVAFTPLGDRLGRGGGYYDRFLAKLPAHARRVGVCFQLQLAESLPSEAHDYPMDAVFTELGRVAP